ncbi:reverse transcriptase [Gossypium australe]|uniref:Reverse transcriptase n=1 Tax=Gossypium australe TaxID=47621 RepID=A0A5B6VE41_9ROSI|nr:reverse transcriptase [Gossypium australe]
MHLEDRLSYLANQDPSDEILAEITNVQMNLNWEADKEELFWEQRARANWLKSGDRNTSYFHKVAINRQFRGRVLTLEDENGTLLTSTEDILKLASDYFGNLFTAIDMGPDDHLFGLMEEKINERMNANLMRHFTDDEITHAVKMMSPLHAPGVDGFPVIFFQRYWHTIGPDISSYCLSILNGTGEISGINKTRIILIPKVDKPKNMSQFRPISICNVLYKIIAKVLVFRVNDVLGVCINEAQGAFVPGMMKHLGFHEEWIILVMRCVCSVSYSVSINGCNSDWFSPSRGLRQGDPLSPFLFLICAECLSILIEEAKRKGLMKGAPIGRARFSINHLFFADDCILFGDASHQGAEAVRDILKEYELLSGQRVNFKKSLIYFGANVNNEVKESITNMLGIRMAHNSEKYLGLPMMVGCKKSWAFAIFSDRFRKRIEGWSLRYLSIGGKKVFIKSVLQAIPIYAMQCFLMPKTFCRKLEGIMNKFWWTNNKSSRGIHWSRWESLCQPKNIGGMGFKDLILPNWTTVDHLIDCETYTWNEELLFNIFDADTARRILSIPIAECRSEDLRVWKYEGSGEYTVKSGYKALSSEHLHNITATSTDGDFYKASSLQFGSMDFEYGKACFAHTFSAAKDQQRQMMALSLWGLWYRRNKPVHKGIKFSVIETVGFLKGYILELNNLREILSFSFVSLVNETWKPPDPGFIKLNFDTAYYNDTKIAITVVLARNYEGKVVGAETYLFRVVNDAFVAEARACERALNMATTLGYRRVIVEGDSLTVIKSIKKRQNDKSVLRPITQNIFSLEANFKEISYRFIPRLVNSAAHALALEGRKRQIFQVWDDGLPDSVWRVVRKDGSAWIHRHQGVY